MSTHKNTFTETLAELFALAKHFTKSYTALMIEAKHIHFVGLGGIGMSALAQLLARDGKVVTGSDRAPSREVQTLLASHDIGITIGHEQPIPQDTELVIYSDAVAKDNQERMEAEERGIRQLNYFQALGAVAKSKRVIAVAGTHGKTTTTGMLAKILIDAGKDPTVVIGSIVTDFGSNFVTGGSDWMLIEACEYRRHFLQLNPDYLVITNIEWDHTDYFKSLEDVQAAFRELIMRVPKSGAIITNTEDTNIKPLLEGVGVRISAYQHESTPALSLIGDFNKHNAQAAKTAAFTAFNIPDQISDASLSQFKGSWRRFQYKGTTEQGASVYDDYAHHPSAIAATLKGVKEKFPDKKITVVFQPHLFSRTKALFEEFTTAFSDADEVLFAPIYAARETLDASVTSEKLASAVTEQGVKAFAYPSLETIAMIVSEKDQNSLILLMGAGDVYRTFELLKQ